MEETVARYPEHRVYKEVRVNPLYAQGYRSLGCAPCTKITNDGSERS
ncbi:MAG: phosphoadenosine phosphosulfate reductase family protein [Deltaproteobacteria bacterium]|jgi:3'-phosphoadenosine 5'-phosphosulfate sulfotransferase (PAPS reductase)/FAD synthetase|nr:MAG: phosphoadenosine phosphosulfate reductase family protein [Deltaproteobacteria bacterium]